MKQILIYRDNGRINLATDFFNKSVIYIQDVYDKFKSLKIELTLNQISKIIESAVKPGEEWLKESELSSISETQELLVLKQFIANKLPQSLGMFRIEVGLMEQTGHIITAKNEAFIIIQDRFSYYAATEASAELSKHLANVCNSLNETINFCHKNNIPVKNLGCEPCGIEFVNFKYRPDISFIRDQERGPRKRTNENKRTILETD